MGFVGVHPFRLLVNEPERTVQLCFVDARGTGGVERGPRGDRSFRVMRTAGMRLTKIPKTHMREPAKI